jgi:hypothetical protein
METVFQRVSCFDFTIAYLRQDQVRNSTSTTTDPTKISFRQSLPLINATSYYIDLCYKQETDFKQLRIKKPGFLHQALPFIDSLDSDQACEVAFEEDDPLREICRTQIQGIMAKGLSNTMQYTYQKIQQSQIDFVNR